MLDTGHSFPAPLLRVHTMKSRCEAHPLGRSLSAATILHYDGRTDQQLTIYLNGRPVSVQVGCSGGHREGAFLAILACQQYGSIERHGGAPALRYLTAIDCYGRH